MASPHRIPSLRPAAGAPASAGGAAAEAELPAPDLATPEGSDLRDAVTVFVTTVGAPTLARCLDHLAAQDCRFEQVLIDHVAPMSVAFQRMIDQCRTPFYVQVDEDMLLAPHAIRSLYDAIAGAPPTVAAHVADLYDEHLERCIFGVKIFRHEIVRRFPLRSIDAFEVDQFERLEADGYSYTLTSPGEHPVAGETLGRHGTEWTADSVFERYFTLEKRRQSHPARMDWLEAQRARFLERILENPTEADFFALQGIIAAAFSRQSNVASAKDYRRYADMTGLRAARALFAELERERNEDPDDRE